jgi:NAD(P)-dependent dehydrogenase (short-subunit alcohol dehydrogenase family)
MAVLRNKTVLVTGASRGIGRTTASALAEAGAHVLVYYGRSIQDAESLVADIRSNEGRADAIRADLGTPEGATLLAKEVSSIVGERLDVLVSNAGISRAATTEVGSAISDTPVPLFRVNRVWEKPSMLQAQELLRRGCLWNTFVTAGRASTFLKVLCAEVPNVVLAINKAPADNELEAAYRVMPAVDLSHQVFAPQPHRLLTVRDVTSGWADLGSPTRVMEILARNNIHPPWLREEYKSLPPSDSFRSRASSDGAEQDVAQPAIPRGKEPKQ